MNDLQIKLENDIISKECQHIISYADFVTNYKDELFSGIEPKRLISNVAFDIINSAEELFITCQGAELDGVKPHIKETINGLGSIIYSVQLMINLLESDLNTVVHTNYANIKKTVTELNERLE